MMGGRVGLPGFIKIPPDGGRCVPKMEKIGGRNVCMTEVVATDGAVFIVDVVVGGVEKLEDDEAGGHLEGPITVSTTKINA